MPIILRLAFFFPMTVFLRSCRINILVLFNQSPVDGQLSGFHLFAVTNSTVNDVHVDVPWARRNHQGHQTAGLEGLRISLFGCPPPPKSFGSIFKSKLGDGIGSRPKWEGPPPR